MIIESRTGRDGTYREDIDKVRRWGEQRNCEYRGREDIN